MSSLKSIFLFDDREFLVYGDTTVQEVEYVDATYPEVAEIRKKRKGVTQIIKSVAASCLTALAINNCIHSSSPISFKIKANGYVADLYKDNIRESFIKNREFLGLKQAEVANALGLSESTIEKFEQGVYPNQSVKTKEAVGIFNEWVSVLMRFHGDRQFVIRPLIKSKSEILGGLSHWDYVRQNKLEGILDLIALERKMYG